MLLYISVIGFAIALLLAFYNKNRFQANYYLVGFFLINAVFGLFFHSIFFSTSINFTAIMYGHFMPILYLSGPLAYFYVRSLISDNATLKKSDLLHFIPFFIVFLGLIPYYLKGFDEKRELVQHFLSDPKYYLTNINVIVPQSLNIILRQAISAIYYALTLRLWIKSRDLVHQKSLLTGIYFRPISIWVQTFLILSLVLTLGVLVLSANAVYRFNAHLLIDRMPYLLFIIGVVCFLLNSSLFIFPEILYGMSRYINPQPSETVVPESKSLEPAAETAATRLQLSEDYLEKIERLVSAYTENKPFLDPEFSLTTISSETNIPLHHLSFYFNTILEISFSDWRNKLRIDFAVSLLKGGFARDHSLNAVSLESGFSSQATFIRAFKNHTGQTPGEYLKTLS